MSASSPHHRRLEIDGHEYEPSEVIGLLGPYLSDRRRSRIASVVEHRTFSVVPVMEGLHDMGNVNAVLRTADGLGFGAAHVIDLQGDARRWAEGAGYGIPLVRGLGAASRQSQGADKWVDVHVWESAKDGVEHLREAGYRILATHLSVDAVPIGEVNFTERSAIVFGNEANGVSDVLLGMADMAVVIPVDGFIQSFNVSVAAAIALYQARADRIARQDRHGDLDERQKLRLTAAFYLRAVRNAEALLRADQ